MASKKRFAFGTDSDVDLDEQRRGAEMFIRNQLKLVRPKDIDAGEYNSPSEFANVFIGDVLGESDITSMYPSKVWEPIAERLLVELYSKFAKSMKAARTKDSDKKIPRTARPSKMGRSRYSRIQMR